MSKESKDTIKFSNKEGRVVEYTREQVADMVARNTQDAKVLSTRDQTEYTKEAKEHGYFRID